MESNPQVNTVDFGEAVLTLREDLDFSFQQHGDVKCYILEDPAVSRFYRIGIPEYTFLSLLDGGTTVNAAVAATAEALGRQALNDHDAAAICKWLVQSQLASTDAASSPDRLIETVESNRARNRTQRMNPMIVRVPFGNPTPLLKLIEAPIRWIFSRAGAMLWLATCSLAAYYVIQRWEDLFSASQVILIRDNWVWLGLTWLGLKPIHELAHATTCRKFGGVVRECGFVFILFAPIPYVDVTSSWRFASKWQRIATSAAGMYAELFVASIAVLIWIHSNQPEVRQCAYYVILMASITTVLFNANFLMRFDGYYILADLLEIPNLYSLGRQYVRYLGCRYALGISATLPRWPLAKGVIVRVYGGASLLWQVLVCISLVATAWTMFSGAGRLLACAALLTWIASLLVSLARTLKRRDRSIRYGYSAAFVLTVVALVLSTRLIPWPTSISAPAVVDYDSASIVRCAAPGFVRAIKATPGQSVVRGDLVLEVENTEMQSEARSLTLQIEQSLIRCRRFQRQGQMGAYQAEHEMTASMQARLQQLETQIEALRVKAPATGTVLSPDLDSLLGTHVDIGDELFRVVDERKKKIVALIAQDDAPAFENAVGSPVLVRDPSMFLSSVSCQLLEVEPQGTTFVEIPALTAVYGGPLAVCQEKLIADHQGHDFQLVEPRFASNIRLSPELSLRWRAGQRTIVFLEHSPGSIADVFARRFSEWLGQRIHPRQ